MRAVSRLLLAMGGVVRVWSVVITLHGVPCCDVHEQASLADLLPVLLSATELRVDHSETETAWIRDKNLAERLTDVLLVQTPGEKGEMDLVTPERRFSRVHRIDITGEPLGPLQATVWVSWEGTEALKREIAAYASAHGARIEVVPVPNIRSKLLAMMRGGGPVADLVMVQADYLPELLRARALQSLPPAVQKALAGELRGWEAFGRDDRVWAIPFYADVQLIYYNRTLVGTEPPGVGGGSSATGSTITGNSDSENAATAGSIGDGVRSVGGKAVGPQAASLWTCADLERLARRLRRQGVIPLAWNAYSAYWFLPFQIGFGERLSFSDSEAPVITGDATRRALRYLVELERERLLVPLDRQAMMGRFIGGRVGMILSGSYSMEQFKETGMDVGVVSPPGRDASGRGFSPLVDFKGLAVTRKARNPILARRLAQFLAGGEVQRRLVCALGKLPARSRAGCRPTAYQRTLERSYRAGTIIPPWDGYAAYKNTMWKLLRFAFTGQMTVDEVLATGQRLLNAQLSEREMTAKESER